MVTITNAAHPPTAADDKGKICRLLFCGDGPEGSSWPIASMECPAKLQRILDDNSTGLVVVIVSDPETSLANTLRAEGSIEGARAAWLLTSNALLKTWRRARRRVRLVNRTCLLGDECSQAALDRAGLTGAMAHLRQSPASFAAVSPLDLLCAAMMIETDPNLKQLAVELRAATVDGDRGADLMGATSEAWSAANYQAASMANTKLAATFEAEAKLSAAMKEIGILEESLAGSQTQATSQAAMLEAVTGELRAAELERELLRTNVKLQSAALAEMTMRIPQIDNLSAKVRVLEGEAIELKQMLANAGEDFRNANAGRLSLQNELDELRHKAHFANIAEGEALAGVVRFLPFLRQTRMNSAITYRQADPVIPTGVQIIDDWTDKLCVGEGGKRVGHEIVSHRKTGHIFYGPYAPVAAGSYAADLQIRLTSGLFKALGYVFEVVSCEEVIASSSSQIHARLESLPDTFPYSPRGAAYQDLEVRLYSPGADKIAINKLRVLEVVSIGSAANQQSAASTQTANAGVARNVNGAKVIAS